MEFDSNEIEKSVSLSDDEYKKIREEGKPLPKKYYSDQRSGKIFAQFHIRGISSDDYKDYKNGDKSFQEIIIGHSLHEDLRYKLEGLDKLVQYVIVDSDMESYIRMMLGKLNPKNDKIQQSKIISKPSGEPTDEWLKSHVIKDSDEMLIDKKGAKIIDDHIIHKKSYWIKPGQVGAGKDTYAYLGTIFTGIIKEGTNREDFHGLFIYPDDNLPETNKKLFDGRFIIHCIKGNELPPTWMIWKAIKNKFPVNPYCSIDSGFHYLIPAEDVKYFGHEAYPEWKNIKKDCE